MAHIIDMPKLSDTMTVGTLVKWLKNEGDAVKSGDMLAEIETDKATMELESFFDGILLKQFAAKGDQVAIGAPLAAIGAPGEKIDAPAAAPKPAVAPQENAPSPTSFPAPVTPPSFVLPPPIPSAPAAGVVDPGPALPRPAPTPPVFSSQLPSSDRLKISPLALRLAHEHSVDVSRLTGSGPEGRIVKADILAALASPPAPAGLPPVPSPLASGFSPLSRGPLQEEKLLPASNMRATIARRLLEAKTQIPHFYVEVEIDTAPLLALREQLNSGLQREGVKLSVNDFVLKGCAEALRRVPTVNASWTGSGIQLHAAAHVGFAVAIDDGLITPVIRDTHLKTIFAISAEARALATRAKDRKLKPEEFTGGTFCVSNLGMFGVERFTAIINPPNAAILAVGTTVKKPVVVEDQIVAGQRMSLTLSCDHRVVDGALGAVFLGALKEVLEKPALLLV
jgi:pyruvate dehydrogenase E2 component (dihydrolipoamide acetyltransferase)